MRPPLEGGTLFFAPFVFLIMKKKVLVCFLVLSSIVVFFAFSASAEYYRPLFPENEEFQCFVTRKPNDFVFWNARWGQGEGTQTSVASYYFWSPLPAGYAESLSYLAAGVQSTSPNSVPIFSVYPGQVFNISAQVDALVKQSDCKSLKFCVRLRNPLTGEFIRRETDVVPTRPSNFASVQIINKTSSELWVMGVYAILEMKDGLTYGHPNFGISNVQIVSYTTSESDAIIQNSSTQDIIDNQNANSEKITDGYSSNPISPSGSDTIDDYDNLEGQIISDQQDGLSQVEDTNKNALSVLLTYQAAFLAVVKFLDSLFAIPFFSALLYFSLSLGVIMLLFNLASHVGSFIRRENIRKEVSARRLARSRMRHR